MKNKKEMLRVLKTEDEGIVLDTTGKKNGRALTCAVMPNACKRQRRPKD